MERLREEIDWRKLHVVDLSGEGILIREEISDLLYTAAWNPLVEKFELYAVPAWPAREEWELRQILATVYHSGGVDIWIRSARIRGLKIEDALAAAARLRDGAFA